MFQIIVFLSVLLLYIPLQSISVYGGDSGELVSAAYTWGIAHPPGYPLYTFFGALLSHGLSIHTVAWRVGLLSSIPMALSVVFLFSILRQMSVRLSISLITSIIFSVSYPVWLYAIVPEVFGLYTCFIMVLTYVSLLYIRTKKRKILYILGFITGLSATHHHAIIFMLIPLYWTIRKDIFKSTKKHLVFFIAAVVFGFMFYVYAPIASSQNPPFDWEHAASIDGFIRLITRAQYGTFRASYGTGNSFLHRILNVMALFQYLIKDFGIPLLVVSCAGIWALWRKGVRERTLLLLPFFLYVFYFFYAGFPTVGDFAVGTIERFMIAPYVYVALFIGFGADTLVKITESFWKKYTTRIPVSVISLLLLLLFGLVPLKNVRIQYPHMASLTYDRTVERLGMDILRILPKNAVVSLSSDTGGFSSYYAYYVLKFRPDIKLIPYPLVVRSHYHEYFHKKYPEILFPSEKLSDMEYMKEFITLNGNVFPMFDEISQKFHPGYWIPYGMLVRYYKDPENLPKKNEGIMINRLFWDTVYNPMNGALSSYRHMLLSDVPRYYASKRLLYGEYLELYDENELAYQEYLKTLHFDPKDSKTLGKILGLEIKMNSCIRASQTAEKLLANTTDYTAFVPVLTDYRMNCPEEYEKQQMIFNEFFKVMEKSTTPLD